MKKALITGGNGDIAVSIADFIKKEYLSFLPKKEELNVADLNSVRNYFLLHGPFDLIINNAGTIHPKRILDSDEELWVRDIMVNLVGAYFVVKKGLEQNKNLIIINIASTAAFAAYKDWGSYCSSKAALVTFTKSLANDGYAAYAIAPGAVLTKFRDLLDLSNDNAQSPEKISNIAVEILKGKYNTGDIIFSRKGETKIM